MDLSNLKPAEGSKHSNMFRRGRGHGSGNGKTAGKGHKGQKARSGSPRIGFEGGQMPLYRRLPKRGFTNRNTKEIVTVDLAALEVFDNDSVVTVETLLESGIIRNAKDGVKILGNGDLTKKLTVKVDAFSASARAKIEELGGTAIPRAEVNICQLERYRDGTVVTVKMLEEAGLVKYPGSEVKILGNGRLSKKLTVQANIFNASAKEKIEALGGKAEVI